MLFPRRNVGPARVLILSCSFRLIDILRHKFLHGEEENYKKSRQETLVLPSSHKLADSWIEAMLSRTLLGGQVAYISLLSRTQMLLDQYPCETQAGQNAEEIIALRDA